MVDYSVWKGGEILDGNFTKGVGLFQVSCTIWTSLCILFGDYHLGRGAVWSAPSVKEETVPPRGGGIGLYLLKEVLSPLWILYHFVGGCR